MKALNISLLWLGVIAISLSLGCSWGPDYAPDRPDHSTRFPETRSISERKVWLSWSADKREGFVLGYLKGNERGLTHACAGREDFAKCKEGQSLDSAGASYANPHYTREYARQVTMFYQHYPQDDDVPIEYVLFRVTGPKKMTGDEVGQEMHVRKD
jgi:hypothetical protein